MNTEDIKQEIRNTGAVAFLAKVSQVLEELGIAEVVPLSAQLTKEVEDVVLYNQPPIGQIVHAFMFG